MVKTEPDPKLTNVQRMSLLKDRCKQLESDRQRLIDRLQQQQQRVEKLEQVYLIAWSIVHSHHSTAAVQEDEMDSCTNDHCREIQAALKNLEAE